MAGAIFLVFILWCVIGGGVGGAIGSAKGRGAEGFVLGLLLGFIGWIIAAVMQPTPQFEARRRMAVQAAFPVQKSAPTRDCPWCAETIKAAAIVCRFCGRDVQPISVPTRSTIQQPPADRWQSDESDHWEDDPFGRHQLRLFSHGQPTELVKDDTYVSKDPIPDT